MKISRRAGATSQILQIFIANAASTSGAGLTGLTNASGSLTAYYHRDTDTTATAIALVTMTVGTFTSSGFKEIDSVNMPGWYQFCPPDAALAAGAASVAFHLQGATNMAPLPIEIDLDAQVDVYLWKGGTVGTPATAGIPDVNVKNMNNVAATSITTINANIGETQPLNFTGTGGSALVKSDIVDVAGAAVSTSTAQIGANVVNIAGAAAALDANNLLKVDTEDWKGGVIPAVNVTGVPKVDVVDWLGTAPLALSSQQIQSVVPSSTVVASVTGAVGSVSVTARVTANADQWAGGTIPAPAVTGVPKIDLTYILGTLLTETAGQIAGAFKKFFNVGGPSLTCLGIDQTGDSFGRIGVAGVGLTNLGDSRIANLDATVSSRLAPAGTLATVTNLTNAPTAGDFTATMKTSLNAATPVVTLAAGAIQAIWDALTSALTTVGSIGKLLVTNIDATISSRTKPADTQAAVTNVTNLANAPTAGDFTAAMKTSLNAATPTVTLSAAAVQAVWDALTSALSTVGSIGKLLVDNVNATISSRLASASISLSAGAVTVGTNNDKAGYALTAAYDAAKTAAQPGDAMALTSGERTTLAGVIWANATRTLTSFGTLVADVATAVWGAATRTLTAFGFTVTTDVSSLVTANLDATVSSRLASAGYTAPPTPAQNADGLLVRNLAGGSDGGRTVQDALRPSRNKVTVLAGTVTVYEEDDTTAAWSGAVSTDPAAQPIVTVDPA